MNYDSDECIILNILLDLDLFLNPSKYCLITFNITSDTLDKSIMTDVLLCKMIEKMNILTQSSGGTNFNKMKWGKIRRQVGDVMGSPLILLVHVRLARLLV
jgi:hypothetical protein